MSLMDLNQARQQAILDDVKRKMEIVLMGREATQAKIFEEVTKGVSMLRMLDASTQEKYLKMAWNQIKKIGETDLEFRRRIGSLGKQYENDFRSK